MKEENYFIFRCSSYVRKSGVYILKVSQKDNEQNCKWRKDNEGENPKKRFHLLNTLF